MYLDLQSLYNNTMHESSVIYFHETYDVWRKYKLMLL